MKLPLLERRLRALGWRLERTNRHRVYVNERGRHLTVGAHVCEDLGPETVHDILRRARSDGRVAHAGQSGNLGKLGSAVVPHG